MYFIKKNKIKYVYNFYSKMFGYLIFLVWFVCKVYCREYEKDVFDFIYVYCFFVYFLSLNYMEIIFGIELKYKLIFVKLIKFS